MTQKVWNLPRNDWLDYGNFNCQQVFKHLKQDSEAISQKGTFHFKVQNEFSSLVKLENRGGWEAVFICGLRVIYVKIKQKIS